MSGIWGTLACGLFTLPLLSKNLATGQGGLVYTGSFHQLGVQALGVAVVGVWTFTLSFAGLWVMKDLWGIRADEEAETAGLDVSEHGMWGYPEFYIPVPGGYGTESHGHLLGAGHAGHALRRPPSRSRPPGRARPRSSGRAGGAAAAVPPRRPRPQAAGSRSRRRRPRCRGRTGDGRRCRR